MPSGSGAYTPREAPPGGTLAGGTSSVVAVHAQAQILGSDASDRPTPPAGGSVTLKTQSTSDRPILYRSSIVLHDNCPLPDLVGI